MDITGLPYKNFMKRLRGWGAGAENSKSKKCMDKRDSRKAQAENLKERLRAWGLKF